MMNALWRTPLGKLVIGGCGTQIGLLLGCGGLVLLTLFCAVCGLTNALTVSVAQESGQWLPVSGPTPTATPGGLPPQAVESLLGQVLLLHDEVQFLRANVPVVAALPSPTPTATPRPYLMATQNGTNLRGGPGIDYNKVGVLPVNETFEIVGRNSDSSWWLVSTHDGLFAWVAADLVSSANLHSNIPVVTIPSLLSWGAPVNAQPARLSSEGSPPALPDAGGPVPFVPTGTPTPAANLSRTFVEDMPSYQRLRGQLLIPPVSASLSPDGKQIAITERIKLYTVTTDGALSYIWLEDNADRGPMGNLAWSPDGQFVAFEIGYKVKYCKPCRGVGILRVADGAITYLEHPGDLDLSAPRWTMDGRLLVNAHPGEPASGKAYIYNASGQGGQPASGTYLLSASHEGQKWYPWQPGKTWLAGSTERADSYNAD